MVVWYNSSYLIFRIGLYECWLERIIPELTISELIEGIIRDTQARIDIYNGWVERIIPYTHYSR